MIDKAAPFEMYFFGIVSLDRTAIYIWHELGDVIFFRPLFEILDIDFDVVIEFEVANRSYDPRAGIRSRRLLRLTRRRLRTLCR